MHQVDQIIRANANLKYPKAGSRNIDDRVGTGMIGLQVLSRPEFKLNVTV